MKKLCSVLMLLTVMFTIVACENENRGHAEQENTKLYDFELSDEEMEKINALDRNEKHD